MGCRSKSHGDRNHLDTVEYDNAIGRYLGFLALACIIASFAIGPLVVGVWIVVILVLKSGGEAQANQPTSADRPRGQNRKR